MNSQLFVNGNIYTMDGALPHATAIAVTNGTIVAVGSDDDVKNLQGDVIDLGGRCVVPGLIDAHVHFQYYALSLQQVDLNTTQSVSEALARVQTAADGLSDGQWIEGRGWQQEKWPDRQFPTAQQLDRATGDHPAFLKHHSGHASWVNTRALQLAGIDQATSDPPGGQIQRDEAGKPTGILFETATELIERVVPEPSERQLISAMRTAQQACWEFGLVGLHDFDGRDCFQALQTMRSRGELGLRFVKNIPVALLEEAIGIGLRSGFGDEWLRMGGVKIFADGALGPRTALMIKPYEGEPQNRGMAVVEKEEMMRMAHRAYSNQLAITVHAIGDQAVHDVLDVYESLLPLADTHTLPVVPNRIEHVQIIHPSDHARLAELGVVASMQPIHATSDYITAERNWGERAKDSYALRTMLDSGATLVFGSDSPIESIDPMLGLHAAVTRQRADGSPGVDGWYPEQRLSIAEAVRGFTLAAAETSRQTATQGSIAAGKLADLTIFDSNIFEVDPSALLETKIAATVVGGDFKHRTF